jgi:hypothetical protein
MARFSVISANVHELSIASELIKSTNGIIIGDRNYHLPKTKGALLRIGFELLAPYSFKHKDPVPKLTGRYRIKRGSGKDTGHLIHRLLHGII